MSETVLRLVADQNSPDNNVRKTAELDFNRLAALDPSQVSVQLVEAAASPQLPVDMKQSCLLHLKRLVPKFWSIGFELFIGPAIGQELKPVIRKTLIELATQSPSLKVRSGSSYVIVQIAAVDYPDEWPDLLECLYEISTDFAHPTGVIGGLAVLNELFDDLITEEQFWDGQVGARLIAHVSGILRQESLLPGVKTEALKLYLTIFDTLLSGLLEHHDRKVAVHEHVVHFSELLLTLVQSLTMWQQNLALEHLNYQYYVFKAMTELLTYHLRFIGPNFRQMLAVQLILDLSYAAKVFMTAEVQGQNVSLEPYEDLDVHQCLVDYISQIFLVFLVLQHELAFSELPQFGVLVEGIVACSVLPLTVVDEYTGDFNTFVTEITGLSSKYYVRDSISDFLIDLNDKDSTAMFNAIRDNTVKPDLDWKTKEAYLFLAESLFLNEDAVTLGQDLPLTTYLASVNALVSGPLNHSLVISRIFLLLPRFFEKFALKLSVNTVGAPEFANTLSYAASGSNMENFDLIQATSLICTTLWKNITGFDMTRISNDAQMNIYRLCLILMDDSEEDTPPVLLEAIAAAVAVDHLFALQTKILGDSTVIDLIFTISFKDPANLLLVVDATETLEAVLADVSLDQYLQVCQKLVPFILGIVGEALQASNVEYSPRLYLALELLGNLIGACPGTEDSSNNFPPEVFQYTFPALKNLIMRTNDDQILQNSGEVFNHLLQKASKFFIEYTDPETKQSGLQILLEVASKFLSPELSDSAAMNCGLIVISLFENFQSYLDSTFFFQLLQVTVRRLVIAQELVTIENLVMVFCKLLLATSPEQLIEALVSVTIEDKGQTKNGLEAVLPIWFNSFEVTRGFEKIKQNVLALGKLFSINDDRVSNMIVNGDLIPYDGDLIITRSMSLSMPDKYTQIPAPLKIIKLLVGELAFQCMQPDASDYLPENVEKDDGNDEWEDMDDIGVPNYEKLKSYVDSDEDEDHTDQGIKEILIQFFRECTTKNLGNFQYYYEMLSDEDKKTITENLVF